VQAVHPETRAGHEGNGMPDDEAHAGVERQASAAGHGGDALAGRPITVGEQTFVAASQPVVMAAGTLRPVGGAGGMSFSAAVGDEAPYDRLYLAHPGGTYVTYMPLHDATGDPSARAAAMDHGLDGGAAAH